MIVAFIPARGGSKRLPRKNLRPFVGHPLIAYSIAAAMTARRVDRCVVSTEDAEIAAVARSYGADVIARPPQLATDVATTASVATHVLEHFSNRGDLPDALVTLQPTCPLRRRGLIDEAIELFLEAGADSVVSITKSELKLGRVDGGYFVPGYAVGTRSQDLPPEYYENGLVYVCRPNVLLETGNLFGRRVVPMICDPSRAFVDIDTERDFEIGEMLFRRHSEDFDYIDAAEHYSRSS